MQRIVTLAFAASFVTACGDIREDFIGSWTASSTTVISLAGENATTQNTGTLSISEGSDPDEITIGNGRCTFTGIVTTPESFRFEAKTCPTESSDACEQMTLSVKQGTGTLTGSNLTLTYSGTIALSCDGNTGTGTFTNTITGSK